MGIDRQSPKPRPGRRRSGRRLILLTGTPGTGKRPLATYLTLERGFVHVDLDNRSTRTRLLRAGGGEFRSELASVTRTNAKVIVTWNFTSETQLAYVETLRSLGFEWIWMDSDRGAAYDSIVARHSTLRPPRFVDPFESDGTYRALEAVTGELRRRRALPRRRRVRVPVPSVKVPSLNAPAWAGVAAFVAAAAAAGTAYVTGAIGPARPGPSPALAYSASPPGKLPAHGVLVSGKSLGGVELGDTQANVLALWGTHYSVCKSCNPVTWFYFDSRTSDAGIAVGFRHGLVTEVFTLGMPDGWHTSDGVHVGQILEQFNDPHGKTTACVGYGATSTRSGDAVTSILTQGQSVYGFALTRPSEPVCH